MISYFHCQILSIYCKIFNIPTTDFHTNECNFHQDRKSDKARLNNPRKLSQLSMFRNESTY